MRILLLGLAILAGAAESLSSQSPAEFDRAVWEADYAALKHELELTHSHLAWFGSPQSGTDLPALDRTTRDALQNAGNNLDAERAIRRFVAGFHDGHLSVTTLPAATAPRPEPVFDASTTAETGCASLGFASVTHVTFSSPFESLPGFDLVSAGNPQSFRSG